MGVACSNLPGGLVPQQKKLLHRCKGNQCKNNLGQLKTPQYTYANRRKS